MKKSAEPFVMLPRSLLASHAWRSASINTRRFLDFMIEENMSHAGKENGRLKAPRTQLREFGIPSRLITAAINEAENLGLVDCHKGGMRVATTYTLNWLPLSNGSLPVYRWKDYGEPTIRLNGVHVRLH
jgi:hypothetical protein